MIRNGVVNIGDTDMDYVAFGEGDNILIVLPGLSDGLATVKNKASLLARPYKPFFKDYSVFMFSRKNRMPDGYSIRKMAEDQSAVLNILGISKASVLGVSEGGMIAQYLAIDYPELVKNLILAVTAPNANPIVKHTISSWIEMAEKSDSVSLTVDTAEKMYSQSYLQKYRRFIPLISKITKPKSYDRFLVNAKAIMEFDARSELFKIICPTLIISGSNDLIIGNQAPHELEREIPHSELYIYDGLGHGAFEEANDFYDRIFAFMDTTMKTN